MGVEVFLRENKFKINLEELIVIGKRINNKKRNFLFLSKVLGKHIEVKPDVCKKAGQDLVKLLNEEEKNKDTLILGFAETATGLGMAVASAIENSYYITTTREDIIELDSILNFDEEHSHAVKHKCFLRETDKLNSSQLILVDDEITTGKSMLNIIREIHNISDSKEYIILTILDWRNEKYIEMYKEFEEELGIKIKVLSLIKGDINITSNEVYFENEENMITEAMEVIDIDVFEKIKIKSKSFLDGEEYIKNSGRFGVGRDEILRIEEEAKLAAKNIQKLLVGSNKILVLGHGENIYIPSRIASYLEGDIYYKSTTRSPIFCEDIKGYPIKEKHTFMHKGVKYYFYNKSQIEKEYDKVVLITEGDLNTKLTDNTIIVRI